MFTFSSKTNVNKKFKMSELLKQVTATKEIRADASCIESVVLKNVISPATINCEIVLPIKEIYVLEITVKEQKVPELFIKALDNVIKLHTLFNVRYGEYELSMLSYKLGTMKGKYYQTNWETEDDCETPIVGSVPDMYKFILSKFLKYPPFEEENVEDYIKRYNQLIKLDFQVSKTQAAIAHETQSKKKFEYNARLKGYKEERLKLLN